MNTISGATLDVHLKISSILSNKLIVKANIYRILCLWLFLPFCSSVHSYKESIQITPNVVILETVQNESYPRSILLTFEAYERKFVAELSLKKNLLPPHYFERHDLEGSVVISHPHKEDASHCHYHGTLRGVKNSWAAISACPDISGVFSDGSDLYHIFMRDGKTVVSRDWELDAKPFKCGYQKEDEKVKRRFRRSVSKVLQPPVGSDVESRYVELVLVNDYKQFVKMDKNKDRVFNRSKQLANIVNSLYAPLNIFVALVGVVIWSEKDAITLSTDGDKTLNDFLAYRRDKLFIMHPNDNAQLITDTVFNNSVVGKALKGPMCTHEYSGGVNMDHHESVGVVATTVAHEMGHNFGMEHDDEKCSCPDRKCVMASASSSPPTPVHWSSCSTNYLQLALEQGMDHCLWNVPKLVVGPDCGNGFLEEGEECDCGPEKFCKNRCCDAATCRFKSFAKCAHGACCDQSTCRLRSAATICRPAKSDCDLPEYCDGRGEFCPSDTHLRDGTPCFAHGAAYCYRKECRSHESQCRLLWGETGRRGHDRCFQRNILGVVNGNCGFNRSNKTYNRCKIDDKMCGTLHCTHENERLEYGLESAATLARFFVSDKGNSLACRSATVDLGFYEADPGQSPDGAVCGKDKACLNRKCISIESFLGPECPADCFGNGVCNNLGQCHCNVGYGPPKCDGAGPGGSATSGPASDPTAAYGFTVAMYILFFCIIPLASFVTFVSYHFRRRIKQWWIQRNRKAAIKVRARKGISSSDPYHRRFHINVEGLKTLDISAPLDAQAAVPLTSGMEPAVQIKPSRPAPPVPAASNAAGGGQYHQGKSSDASNGNVISPLYQESSRRGVSRSTSTASIRKRPSQPPPPRPNSPPTNTTAPNTDETALDFSDTVLAFVHSPTATTTTAMIGNTQQHNRSDGGALYANQPLLPNSGAGNNDATTGFSGNSSSSLQASDGTSPAHVYATIPEASVVRPPKPAPPPKPRFK